MLQNVMVCLQIKNPLGIPIGMGWENKFPSSENHGWESPSLQRAGTRTGRGLLAALPPLGPMRVIGILR